MSSCRNFFNLARNKRVYLYKPLKSYSTNVAVTTESSKNPEIIVPYRIERGPTDILKALASTVKKDYTAPQYKYEDDPYFIPASNISKRTFALSKESGRRSARYFLENFPENFTGHDIYFQSDPKIKQFHPAIVYTEENVKSPDVLLECIKDCDVVNSVKIYKILKEKGIAVSQEMKQELLELLCFYNGTQPPYEDYYEERYFQRKQMTEKWDKRGEAERLFDEMEKDSKAYSALIAGAGRFQDPERVLQLFEEMTAKNIVPTVEAYNSFISVIPWLKERRDSGCEFAMFQLNNMKKDGLVPNLYTMNAVLEVFSRRRFNRVGELALSIIAEMKNLKIEPSLGTYKNLLDLFTDEHNFKPGILYEVIDKLEGKELIPRHPSDVTFFYTAMAICYQHIQDKDLAYRINKIVEHGNNCKLLGNAYSESLYFKNLLKLLCETEDFEKFMEIYDNYIPNTYTPEPSLMFDILQQLQLTGYYKYLPKLCTDVYVFEQSERENILALIMEMAGCTRHEKQVQEALVESIWKIVKKINTRLEGQRFNFCWNGTDLGNALNVFVNAKDLEKAWSVMEQIGAVDSKVIGPPSKQSLLKFCEVFLENREYAKVKFCINFAVKEAYPEFGTDFKNLTDDMYQNEQLETKQRVHVDEILRNISIGEASIDSSSSSEESSSDSSSSSKESSSDYSSSSDEEDNK